MTTCADEAFAQLVDRATTDDGVLGLIVGGGRGKGQVTVHSDYDVYLVLADGAAGSGYEATSSDVEVATFTLDEFRAHAEVGSPSEWNRYNFAHVTAQLDKTGGEVQRIADSKEFLPADRARQVAASSLDGYLNSAYRSAKNARDGDPLAGALDAAESVPHLLQFVYACAGRVRPYNKFLAWELQHHPLASPRMSDAELLSAVEGVVRGADARAQGQLYVEAVGLAEEHELTEVVLACGPASLEVLEGLGRGSASG